LSEHFQSTMAGRKPLAIAEGMVSELNLAVKPEVFLDDKTSLFHEKAKTSLEPMPGAINSIHRFRDAGYRLAIGTSLDASYLNIILRRFNISGLFEAIVTGDQITQGKPHPETYLLVIHKLGLQPDECVVFEDAETGILSAKAAGAWCIAVKNAAAIDQDTSAADLTVASLEIMTVGLIHGLASTQASH